MMKKLPNVFYAEAFVPAAWSADYSYAAEIRTNLQFYLYSPEIRRRLVSLKRNGIEKPIIKLTMKKARFLLWNRYYAYDESSIRVGRFSDPAGGGPDGNFYEDVNVAYS